ncbi:MAG: imidazolonepropionase, partial [Gammaproteobacteria bacterium]|nr:imidazolonepropionase [Gammaproteobacteria bacterium]
MTGYLLENLNFASMPENGTSYGIVDDGAIAVDGRKIAWCGERPQLPSRYSSWRSYDLKQRFLTPGLIDCHTHIVHGGNRVSEFEMRLQGMSYQEITEQGGGINATLDQTRRLSVSELVEQALPRI